MEKYGYKNISSRNEFEQSASAEGKHQFSYNSGKFISNYDFIDWGSQGRWGVPGQTRYTIKTANDLIGANSEVSKIVEK